MAQTIFSISAIEHILDKNGFIISHSDHSTVIYHKDNIYSQVEVLHNDLKKLLRDNKIYKSYNLFLRAYEDNKDKDSVIAQKKASHSLDMINKLIYTRAVNMLFNILIDKQLININSL